MIIEETLTDPNYYESLDWLELDAIPDQVYNPLLARPMDINYNPYEEMVGFLMNPEYLYFVCRHILCLEDIVPYQLAILDTFWHRKMPMLIGCRGSGKSFCMAIYCLLKMLLQPGCKIVIVGSSFRQSKIVFDYMSEIWDRSDVLRDIAGNGKKAGPRRDIDRCEFFIGSSRTVAIPIGTGEKIRGLRANIIIADEFASISEEIFNTVIRGFAAVASNPLEKIKEAAMIKNMKKKGLWSPELEKLRTSQATGNQIIFSGTAYYEFNHFYRYWQQWKNIIISKAGSEKLAEVSPDIEKVAEGLDHRDYAVIRIPYYNLPAGLLDDTVIAQAKAGMHNSLFLLEYGACFLSDSNGFYKRSIIEAATTNKPIKLPDGAYVQFHAQKKGDTKKAHVIAIDPAADTDNAAIVVLELNTDHRKVVYCWTTNRKVYDKYKQYMRTLSVEIDDDYYNYIAKKIRELMQVFNTEHIIMDKNGGGVAVAEALSSRKSCKENEMPVYPIPDPEDIKFEDNKPGLHILELLHPTGEINSNANHGMLKDLQDKVLLFPLYDTVELEKAIILDEMNNLKFDTYEQLAEEIEELKNELTTIVCTPSSQIGNETFHTPDNVGQGPGKRRTRMRKDRYSALLYANYYARNKDKNQPIVIEYKATGASTKDATSKMISNKNTGMYYGPGLIKFKGYNKNYDACTYVKKRDKDR